MNKFKATAAASAVLLGGVLGGMTTPQPAEAQNNYQMCHFDKAGENAGLAYFKRHKDDKCQDYRTGYADYPGGPIKLIPGSNLLVTDCWTFTEWKDLDVGDYLNEGVHNICKHMQAADRPPKIGDKWYTESGLKLARPFRR